MLLKDMVNQIAALEASTFSDAWSKESLMDTLDKDYNIIFFMCTYEGISRIYRIKKNQDVLCYEKTSDENWNLRVFDYKDISQEGTSCDQVKSWGIEGYIVANLICDETELLRIAVDETKRGKGIGSTLMEFYLNDVSDECEKAFLEVRASNQGARGLYENIGYQEISKRTAYYNNPIEDGIIYQYDFL
ncbi:MAG: GNAT family N-acetyltransferase [Lachnospiraceae bacterium]|nr:GNAT family N-acetyltransferase [Lachnospiraceae bacterium]